MIDQHRDWNVDGDKQTKHNLRHHLRPIVKTIREATRSNAPSMRGAAREIARHLGPAVRDIQAQFMPGKPLLTDTAIAAYLHEELHAKASVRTKARRLLTEDKYPQNESDVSVTLKVIREWLPGLSRRLGAPSRRLVTKVDAKVRAWRRGGGDGGGPGPYKVPPAKLDRGKTLTTPGHF